jgi:hypothetical protein
MKEDYNNSKKEIPENKYIPNNLINFEEAKRRIEDKEERELIKRIIDSVKDLGW